MKALILTLIFSFIGLGQGVPSPGTIATLDFDQDGIRDLEYLLFSTVAGPNTKQMYYAAYSRGSAEMIMPTKKRGFFNPSELIQTSLPLAGGGGVLLTTYYAEDSPVGWLYSYADWSGSLNATTSGLAGFRIHSEDGYHLGWVRFTRPDLGVTTPFVVAGWDYNPIPDEPIAAGLPPEIPMTATVVDDGGGHAVLRVSWNPAVSNWVFETSRDLKTPVRWTPYPSNSTYAEIPLTGDDPIGYFRLRKP